MKDQKWFEDMELRIPHGEVRTRFAPSPTGYMHVGNLRTALYTYLIARHAGGKFILRIEDTDQGRYVEGAVDVIYSTMRACGLTHDEGPDVGGPVGPYVQTERRGLYKEYAELLIARGHAYRCFCDKDDAAEENVSDGTVIHKYDGRCSRLSEEEIAANLAAGKPYVIRQKIPREGKTTFHDEIFGDITVDNDTLDDQVLIKRDGLPTYNFANVIDDHLMGITHVVRGSEYLSSTPKYNLLYEGFGWEIPKYIHCSPVMRDQHNKMSKRHGDPSYEDLIAQGYLSQAVVNYVALLGWAPGGEREIYSLPELVEAFDIKGISKSPAIFDIDKLRYFNSEYIRAMTPEQFAAVAAPYIRQTVKILLLTRRRSRRCCSSAARCSRTSPKRSIFSTRCRSMTLRSTRTRNPRPTPPSRSRCCTRCVRCSRAPDVGRRDPARIHEGAGRAAGSENAKVMWPVRIAVSGRAVTPGGAVEICRILGREETLRRIDAGIAKLEG